MSSLLSPINPSRLRSLPKFYSWLDHRLVHEGHLKKLSCEAATMYLFLVTVGDRQGMSYYSDRAVCKRINISDIYAVRRELTNSGLIAYAKPIYQVLSLPASIGYPVQNSVAACGDIPASEEEISALFSKFRGCRR